MSIIKANSASFKKEVLESDRPVLLDFSAEWCGPCKALEPTLENIAGAREDIKVVKVDVDESKDIAKEYKVRSMPTLMLVSKGKIVSTFSGQRSLSNLNKWIDENKDNTEKRDFKAEFSLKALSEKEEVKKAERKYKSFGARIKSAIMPAAVTIGGVVLATAATGPVGVVLGIGAAVSGVHSIYKQQKVRGGFIEIMNMMKADDKEGLEKKFENFLSKFNPYTFFGRNIAKGAVTAAAGIALIGATSGVGLALFGGAIALYGGLGALANAGGLIGTHVVLKKLETSLDEAEAKETTENEGEAVKPKAELAPKVDAPQPAASFNPAANQNTPEVDADKTVPSKPKADKKAKPGA